MVASIPLPCTAWNRPASARKDPGEATEGSAAAVPSSDRQLLEPSSQSTAALCTGAGSLPLDTGIGTHDHLGAVLATSQIAPREPLSDRSAPEVNTHGVNRPKADVDLERP